MGLICLALSLYTLILFGAIIIHWVRPQPGTGLGQVADVLDRMTEPALRPLRSVIPPVRIGDTALDLSPIVVLLGIQILQSMIC